VIEWLADKALNLILVPVITCLAGFLVNFLHERAKAMSTKKHLSILAALIAGAVDAANQTEVAQIKGTADWTPEKQAEIFQAVKRRVMSQLTTDTQKVLSEAYAQPEQFIEQQIEKAGRESKKVKG